MKRMKKFHGRVVSTLRVAICIIGLTTSSVYAGEFELKPNIAVSEEYTDNVFDVPRKQSDFITRVLPGGTLLYKAPLWDWDLAYNLDYRYYARLQNDNTTHILGAKGLVRLVDEVFFLELSDTYKRVSLDVTRDTTLESLSNNQSDQNLGVVSPYLVLHPTAALTVKTGYRYTNTWYKEPSATDKRDHAVFLDSSYEITPKFFANFGYIFTREDASRYGFYRHEFYVGPRYEYAEKSFFFAHGGATVTEYDDQSQTVNPTWNAGLTHAFDTVTASLSTGVKYTDDPLGTAIEETSYSASLQKILSRGVLSVTSSYTEFADTRLDRTTRKRFSSGFSSTYELVQDLRGGLGFTYEHYNDLLVNGHTNKYFVSSSLYYDFGKGLSAGLSYSLIDYSSPTIAIDNRQVNRVILDLKKSF